MSVPVIWNANAGGKVRGPLSPASPEALEQVLSEAGITARIIPTQSAEDAEREAARIIESREKLLIAAGGDGTIGELGKQLMGTDTALGLLPLGSVMNIARMLGVPRDLKAAAEVLAVGRRAQIDVGVANGVTFFETASVGLNAAVFRQAQHFEDGDWGSVLRAAMAAFRYTPGSMELTLDEGQQLRTRALLVTVSNAPYTGVAMTVAPEARLDDGKFDVRVFRRFSKWELVRHLTSITFGRRRYSPHIETYRSARVRIISRRPLPCRADSHDLGTTPLECEVRPGSLTVIVGPDYIAGRALPDTAE